VCRIFNGWLIRPWCIGCTDTVRFFAKTAQNDTTIASFFTDVSNNKRAVILSAFGDDCMDARLQGWRRYADTEVGGRTAPGASGREHCLEQVSRRYDYTDVIGRLRLEQAVDADREVGGRTAPGASSREHQK